MLSTGVTGGAGKQGVPRAGKGPKLSTIESERVCS